MNTQNIKKMAMAAKKACFKMAIATTKQKNEALEILIQNLKRDRALIFQANKEDMSKAKLEGLSAPLLERLSLEGRFDGLLHEIEQVIELPDPIGELFEESSLANGIEVTKCRVPIGVLGVIYESRPNVTLDISALSLKSGNCAILRGGSETLGTNTILVNTIQNSLAAAGLPIESIQLIENLDRKEIKKMLKLDKYVDLIIPRGSAGLQRFCRQQSTIPVLTGGVGICHLFVDATANQEQSIKVILNAKTQRPTVCNALNTLLVEASIATHFVPKVVETLSRAGVHFRLDVNASKFVQHLSCKLAESTDWDTEWLSLVLGIKVVKNIDQAIDHIHLHSTGHSDGILTECSQNAEFFVRNIDSAAVYVNASTRFTDGGQLGLGAEVAVSTQKLHARGPVGLRELTSYKWIIRGNYQVRA